MIRSVLILLSLLASPAAFCSVAPGAFFDPARNGEGIFVETHSGNRALVYWFTYDGQGNQRWLLGEGTSDGDTITIDGWLSAEGARFGNEFDPRDVVFTTQGFGRIEFSGCDELELEYSLGDVAGEIAMQRLIPLALPGCEQKVWSVRSGLSGSHFDPDRSGEGIVFQVYAPARALLVWFTFDTTGKPMWVLADGAFKESRWSGEALVTSGGVFGPDFDLDLVQLADWGRITLEAKGCDRLGMAWESQLPGFGDGSLDLQRLTSIKDETCSPAVTQVLPELNCGQEPRGGLDGPSFDSGGVVPNALFLPSAGCMQGRHTIHGSLEFSARLFALSGIPNEFNRQVFPRISTNFITVGNHLVPGDPKLLRPENSSPWRLVFGNGRIWSEEGDMGLSRAVLPVSMAHSQWNEGHNGLLALLFDDSGIKSAFIQFTQETVPWDRKDYWTKVEVNYDSGPVPAADRIEFDFRESLALRYETDSLDSLPSAPRRDFKRNIVGSNISQTGILLKDTLYLDESLTRTGNYPFPDDMRHGAFSVTKTAAGAVALMRLAQKYGASVLDERLVDYVEVTASHNGWQRATFSDALSMVVGVGEKFPNRNTNATFADEGDLNLPYWNRFNFATNIESRLRATFDSPNYPWGPGEVVRYNSAHTFVLAVAMDRFYKQQEGPDADLWQMLNEEVYRPIGIRWLPAIRVPYQDGRPGVVPMGWGILPTVDESAKIARLFHNGGKWRGQQLLYGPGVRAMYGRTSPDARYVAGHWVQGQPGIWNRVHYRDAAWSTSFEENGCRVIVPWMEGLGGNFVATMPSGQILIRYADANLFDVGALALTGMRLESQCETE